MECFGKNRPPLEYICQESLVNDKYTVILKLLDDRFAQ